MEQPGASLLKTLNDRQEETERANRLPADLSALMVADGLFRVAVPRAYGGEEHGLHRLMDVVREVSRADGAAGLVMANAVVWQIFSARLPRAGYEEIYGGGPDVVIAGSFNGVATATPEDDGYVVRGRWSFASGCENAEWLLGLCTVEPGAQAAPAGPVVCYVHASEATIEPNWSVAGMAGTGSNDVVVDAVYVPAHRTFPMRGAVSTGYGGIYDAPIMSVLALIAAPVAVGICEAATTEIRRLAAVKTPLRSQGDEKVRDRASVKLAVATAVADATAARAVLASAADVVADWSADEAPDLEERATVRLCASHAVAMAAEGVRRSFTAGGATSVRLSSPLQRYLRNVSAMTQLSIVSEAQYELVAEVLLGIAPRNPEHL